MADQEAPKQNSLLRGLNSLFTVLDDAILIVVAFGIIIMAMVLLIDAAYDGIFFWSSHTVAHLVSELMFVLIIMELFRQVLRQLNRHVFSLNPFIYIGFIASVRGILLTQMSLALGELEWKEGVVQLVVHALIVLILVISYYLYARIEKRSMEKQP